MYFLFRYHNITPSAYKKMGRGEKKVVKNFMHKEIEERNKEREQVGGLLGGLF